MNIIQDLFPTTTDGRGSDVRDCQGERVERVHCAVADLSGRYKALDRQAKQITKQMKEIKEKMIQHANQETGDITGLDGCLYATYRPVTRCIVDKAALEADYKGLFSEGSKYVKVSAGTVFKLK